MPHNPPSPLRRNPPPSPYSSPTDKTATIHYPDYYVVGINDSRTAIQAAGPPCNGVPRCLPDHSVSPLSVVLPCTTVMT
eukprot:768268-Hanusia_phi.AAC.4